MYRCFYCNIFLKNDTDKICKEHETGFRHKMNKNIFFKEKFKSWLNQNTKIFLIENVTTDFLHNNVKIYINGVWYGVCDDPINFVDTVKYFNVPN